MSPISEYEEYKTTGMIGGYRPENASIIKFTEGAATTFIDTEMEFDDNPETPKLIYRRRMDVGGRAYLVTSVTIPEGISTPTDKLKALNDAELKSRTT
jgi:hypothetical protein